MHASSRLLRWSAASKGLIVVASLIALSVVLPPAAVAKRRGPAITPARARTLFVEVLRAAQELQNLDVQPADANGQVRAWDRRWRVRLNNIAVSASLDGLGAIASRTSTTCEVREIDAWVVGWASDVTGVRAFLYQDAWLEQSLTNLTVHARQRHALASEARRRLDAGLSCEDLPQLYEMDEHPDLLPVATEPGRDHSPVSAEATVVAPELL